MREDSKSVAIHTPKTLHDLAATLQRVKSPLFFAGGTYLMNSPSFYPCETYRDIMDISQIAEFRRISRNDRTLEIGSMVSLEHIMSAGRLALPALLLAAIENSGTLIVRQQSTLGGSLGIRDRRLAVSGALAALDAEVQVYTLKNQRLVSSWRPVTNLYTHAGKLAISERDVIGGVRFSDEKESSAFQMIAGDVMQQPGEAVIASLACYAIDSVISRFRISLIFPSSLFIAPQDLNLLMNGINLPLASSQMSKVRRMIEEQIDLVIQEKASSLQRERAKRLIEALLHALNVEGLSGKL